MFLLKKISCPLPNYFYLTSIIEYKQTIPYWIHFFNFLLKKNKKTDPTSFPPHTSIPTYTDIQQNCRRERKKDRNGRGIEPKIISVNGLNIHVAEKGEGPLVLFLHGFPQLWYSWRHQITFMASHGYRAVAPDLRGYGDTTGAPIDDANKFSVLHVVGDMVALLVAITPEQEDKKVFVVGHDWGAHIGWHLCLFRPNKVKAVVNLSVQYLPRNPLGKVVEYFHAAYGEDHYIVRFQEPGDMEAEIASMGTKTFLKKFMSFRKQTPFYFPKGKGFGDDNAPVI